MGGKERKNAKTKSGGRSRFFDVLIILLCLSGAAYSIYLFRLDLFRSINSRDKEPVGTITARTNNVQRRLADRVLWDRLSAGSPVYLGDMIRTAKLSSAAIRIEGSNIDLDENTLIRILRTGDGESLWIELNQGSLGITTGAGGGNLTLALMGPQVELGQRTVLNASVGENGLVLQVSEGTAVFIYEGQSRELTSGTMIILDAAGIEQTGKAAVVTLPGPNARYLKNGPEPFPVNFSWSRINLGADDRLRLEIAKDRNFAQVFQRIDGLNTAAQALLDTGLWYWRLSSGDETLTEGQFTIADAAGPRLISPAENSLYRYRSRLPLIRFQWTETEGASSYLLEVSQTPEFTNPRISRYTEAVFLIESTLGTGTWYWRVMPVFPAIYEGSAAFSSVSFFRVEQGDKDEIIVVLSEPEPEPAVPVSLSLLSPAPGASIPGLTALRQQTEFRWEADGEIGKSRFLLSRSSNPLQGRPLVEIANPDRTVRLDRLDEGTWYWTVEAETPSGLVSAADPRQLRVLSIPLLPAPLNRLPPNGHRIGIEELQAQRSVTFSWSPVQGANAYILTLYQVISGGRRQILQRAPENRTSWILDNLRLLERGTFIWQVEAVNRGQGNRIEQRGAIGENSFIIDLPFAGPVELEDPGILYGN